MGNFYLQLSSNNRLCFVRLTWRTERSLRTKNTSVDNHHMRLSRTHCVYVLRCKNIWATRKTNQSPCFSFFFMNWESIGFFRTPLRLSSFLAFSLSRRCINIDTIFLSIFFHAIKMLAYIWVYQAAYLYHRNENRSIINKISQLKIHSSWSQPKMSGLY